MMKKHVKLSNWAPTRCLLDLDDWSLIIATIAPAATHREAVTDREWREARLRCDGFGDLREPIAQGELVCNEDPEELLCDWDHVLYSKPEALAITTRFLRYCIGERVRRDEFNRQCVVVRDLKGSVRNCNAGDCSPHA